MYQSPHNLYLVRKHCRCSHLQFPVPRLPSPLPLLSVNSPSDSPTPSTAPPLSYGDNHVTAALRLPTEETPKGKVITTGITVLPQPGGKKIAGESPHATGSGAWLSGRGGFVFDASAKGKPLEARNTLFPLSADVACPPSPAAAPASLARQRRRRAILAPFGIPFSPLFFPHLDHRRHHAALSDPGNAHSRAHITDADRISPFPPMPSAPLWNRSKPRRPTCAI